MRQFVFRGKTIKGSRWIYGDLFRTSGNTGDGIAIQYFDKVDGWMYYDIRATTIGQFTGLYDKNETPVYEGDVLHVIEWENLLFKEFSDDNNRFNLFTLEEIKGKIEKEYTSPVFWDEGGFCIGSSPGDKDVPLCCLFGDIKRSSPIFDFEIIGNIYDNPELIKK